MVLAQPYLMFAVVAAALIAAVALAAYNRRAPEADRGEAVRPVGRALRVALVLLLAVAAGRPQLPAAPGSPAVVLAVDVSDSMRDRDDVAARLADCARALPDDSRVSLVAFGGPAPDRVEGAPAAAEVVASGAGAAARAPNQWVASLDEWSQRVHTRATDIAQAVRVAQRNLDGGGHVVVFSDGLSTHGDAATAAAAARQAGVLVHAAPLQTAARDDVLLRFEAPARTPSGQPVALDVHVGGTARGETQLVVRRFDAANPAGLRVFEQRVDLSPALPSHLRFTDRPEGAGWARYVAEIRSDVAEPPENNSARAVVRLQAPPRVALIGPGATRLQQALEPAFRTRTLAPAELADAAVLRDVSVAVLSGIAADELTPEAEQTLARFVVDYGGGLLALGGATAFGAGGWRDDDSLPRVLPVSMRPRDGKRVSLVFVIDRSGSMGQPAHAGAAQTKLEFVRERLADLLRVPDAATAAGRGVLSARDEVALVGFSGAAEVLLPPVALSDLPRILGALNRLTPGRRTNILAGLNQGLALLREREAQVRQLLLLSDGIQDVDATSIDALVGQIDAADITLSSVGIGRDKNWSLLRKLRTGSGQAWPDLALADLQDVLADEVARAKYEHVRARTTPLRVVASGHALQPLLGDALPAVAAYNRVSLRPGATLLADAGPPQGAVIATEEADPVFAVWRRGLGRAAVFAAGPSWAPYLAQPDGVLLPLVRWLHGEVRHDGFRLNVISDDSGDRVQVTALEPADGTVPPRSRNLLNLSVRVTPLAADATPSASVDETPLLQTGLGRYEAPLRMPPEGLVRLELLETTANGSRLVAETVHAAATPLEWRRLGADATVLAGIAAAGGGRIVGDGRSLRAAVASAGTDAQPVDVAWLFVLAAVALFLAEIALRSRRRPVSPPRRAHAPAAR